jgi:hypothetical protein
VIDREDDDAPAAIRDPRSHPLRELVGIDHGISAAAEMIVDQWSRPAEPVVNGCRIPEYGALER